MRLYSQEASAWAQAVYYINAVIGTRLAAFASKHKASRHCRLFNIVSMGSRLATSSRRSQRKQSGASARSMGMRGIRLGSIRILGV